MNQDFTFFMISTKRYFNDARVQKPPSWNPLQQKHTCGLKKSLRKKQEREFSLIGPTRIEFYFSQL